MMFNVLPLLTLLLCPVLGVTLIDNRNFSDFTSEQSGPAMVLFFAPWCGHCKQFKPNFKEAGDKLQGIVKFGAIDCTVDTNQSICGAEGIKGYPTVKLFNSEKVGTKVIEYTGDRTVANVLDFVMSNVKDFAFEVKSSEELAKHLSNEDDKERLVMISKGVSRTALSHAVSRNYLKSRDYLNKKAADHAIVVLDSPNVLANYTGPYEDEIKSMATSGGIMMISPEGKAFIFEGELVRKNVVEWVKL